MAKLKLRPWKFKKGEKVRLYWLCSPFKKESGTWTIRAVFVPNATISLKIIGDDIEQVSSIDKYSNDYQILELPWGSLPNLRVGRVYADGIVESVSPVVSNGRVLIPNFQDGDICEAFDLPIRFYNFFKNWHLGKEKLWRFKVGEITYYLPCLEIIRAFFASSKTLTNQILKPDGLSALMTEEFQSEESLSVKLSHEIPRSILNQETITHLLWLSYDDTANAAWKSVYSGLYAKAIGKSVRYPATMFAKGLPLEVKPPIAGTCQIHFTGTNWDKNCLIHEILSVSGFPPLRFRYIKYSHPSYKTREKVDKTKAKRKIHSSESGKGLIQDSARRGVKTKTKQPLAEIAPTIFSFLKLPNLKRYSIAGGVIADGKESSISKGNAPLGKPVIREKDETVGTDESYIGGEVTPVEFLGLKLAESKDFTGLEEFHEAIRILQTLNPRISIRFNVYKIPGNSSFCIREDGRHRNFALAQVTQDDIQPAYILEVARPDEWDVSTLIVQFHSKIKKQEKIMEIIETTIKHMVDNNGHWQIEVLEQSADFRFSRVKHFQEISAEHRAIRLNGRLWDIGFR
jgi:hypothetical protein